MLPAISWGACVLKLSAPCAYGGCAVERHACQSVLVRSHGDLIKLQGAARGQSVSVIK